MDRFPLCAETKTGEATMAYRDLFIPRLANNRRIACEQSLFSQIVRPVGRAGT
jgi:hypothetical protein